jgi:hypothetical protein
MSTNNLDLNQLQSDHNLIALVQEDTGWKIKFTKWVLVEYERFLYLRSMDDTLSPSIIIDTVWHLHILCTKQYAEYCINTFGKFVHHDAYDMIRFTESEKKNRLANTLVAYRSVFGQTDDFFIWSDKMPKNTNTITTTTIPSTLTTTSLFGWESNPVRDGFCSARNGVPLESNRSPNGSEPKMC